MADPNEAPSPAALREMADEWKQFCRSHEHGETAVTEWMVRGTLMADKLRACATALEAKNREIARLDPYRSLKCPHGWRSWECSECIRARGKEPKP